MLGNVRVIDPAVSASRLKRDVAAGSDVCFEKHPSVHESLSKKEGPSRPERSSTVRYFM